MATFGEGSQVLDRIAETAAGAIAMHDGWQDLNGLHAFAKEEILAVLRHIDVASRHQGKIEGLTEAAQRVKSNAQESQTAILARREQLKAEGPVRGRV